MAANKLKKKWTDESIKRELQALVRQHGVLTWPLLEEHGPHILSCIGRHGGAQAVCARLGIPFKMTHVRWTRDSLLLEIRRRSDLGESLNSGNVPERLIRHARKYFGNWRNALEAVGVDYVAFHTRGRKWTEQAMEQALRELAQRHGALDGKLIDREHSALFRALEKTEGGVQSACQRFGVPYVTYLRKWTEEDVKEGLRRLSERHGGLYVGLVQKHDPKLMDVINRRFGRLKGACERFGLRYVSGRLKRSGFRRSREELIEELKRREREGKKLNSAEIQQEGCGLVVAAKRLCGTWRQALTEAGIDYDAHHFRHRNMPRPNLRKWRPESMREALAAWAAEHGALSTSGLINSGHQALDAAVRRHLGSLERACERFGLPYEPKCEPWPLERILEEIRKLGRQKRSLSLAKVKQHHPKLVKAVHGQGYTWEEMVESAGFSYKRYIKQRRWTPERLAFEFQRFYERHGEVNDAVLGKEDDGLRQTLRLRYGSLAKAAQAFGFVYRSSLKSWNRERVVAQILSRLREGQGMRQAQVRIDDLPLESAARRYFGGWENAIRAAGLDYDKFRQKPQWTPQKID